MMPNRSLVAVSWIPLFFYREPMNGPEVMTAQELSQRRGKYGMQRTWNELDTKHYGRYGRRNPIRDDDGLLE